VVIFGVGCLARRLGSILEIYHSLNQYDQDYRLVFEHGLIVVDVKSIKPYMYVSEQTDK
jgi:hypothetical protein